MANRVQLGNLGSGVFGLKVSKPSVNVLTASDKDLLFDSTKARTGQIYAGANGLDFVGNSTDSDPQVIGTVNIIQTIFGTDLRGSSSGRDTVALYSARYIKSEETTTNSFHLVSDLSDNLISEVYFSTSQLNL